MNVGRVLIASYGVPLEDRDSGGRRICDLMRLLVDAGWSVEFVSTHGPAAAGPPVDGLRRDGVRVHAPPRWDDFQLSGGTGSTLAARLESGSFDLAILAYWPVAEFHLPLIRRLAPATRVLVDSVDLHFVRHARRAAVQGDRCQPLLDETFGEEVVRELNVYAAADAVLTVSDDERLLLEALLGPAVVARTVPDFEAADPSPVPIGDRRGLLLLGSYDHEPNVEGLRFFLDRIRPAIDRQLLARHPVSVVGSNLAAALRPGDAADAAVRMVGWVPNLQPYLHHARVAVVPLLHGAGTKRKVVQALMHGTPLVTTSIGAEGFDLIDGRHALIADDAARLGHAIERLLRDDTLAGELAIQGLEHIRARHGRESARRSLLAAVGDTLAVAARPAALPPLSFERYIARLARETAARASRNRPTLPPFAP